MYYDAHFPRATPPRALPGDGHGGRDAGWPCETQPLQRSKFAPSASDGVDLRGQTPNRLTLGKPGVAGGLVSDDIPALPGRASVREHLSGAVDGMPREGPAGDRYTWFTCGGRDVKVTESAVRRAIRKLAVLIDGQEFRPKQTLAGATALDRNSFSTLTACRVC